ncbi:MAG: LysM peptidoglycan-binding domain-containing protein [bacterium]|nr:LysM peptidoglycan-binding domain-containing protein [bacterium]
MLDYEIKNSIESPFYSIYEIKKGDTLYKISKEYNVNTKLLAELNGLDLDDYIYPGQGLLVPKKDVSYYITKDGDTLYNVSKIFGLDQEDLIKQNKTIYLLPEQMIFYKRD